MRRALTDWFCVKSTCVKLERCHHDRRGQSVNTWLPPVTAPAEGTLCNVWRWEEVNPLSSPSTQPIKHHTEHQSVQQSIQQSTHHTLFHTFGNLWTICSSENASILYNPLLGSKYGNAFAVCFICFIIHSLHSTGCFNFAIFPNVWLTNAFCYFPHLFPTSCGHQIDC